MTYESDFWGSKSSFGPLYIAAGNWLNTTVDLEIYTCIFFVILLVKVKTLVEPIISVQWNLVFFFCFLWYQSSKENYKIVKKFQNRYHGNSTEETQGASDCRDLEKEKIESVTTKFKMIFVCKKYLVKESMFNIKIDLSYDVSIKVKHKRHKFFIL